VAPCSKTASALRDMQQASGPHASAGTASPASRVWYGHCSRTSTTSTLLT